MGTPQISWVNTTHNNDNVLAAGLDLDSVKLRERPRVLIIDDDLDYIEMLKVILRIAGFDVAGASDCDSALEKCDEINPDVILLDLMIPYVDGWGIYKMLQEMTNTPVIVVSASGNRDNAVKSLDMGAYDYISKPFYNPEIIARINRVIRSFEHTDKLNILFFPTKDLSIDYETHEIIMHGEKLHLMPREFKFITILAENAPKNVNYKDLTEKLWGNDNEKTRAHLKNIVFGLRKKIGKITTASNLIWNHRSLGYQLNASKKESDLMRNRP